MRFHGVAGVVLLVAVNSPAALAQASPKTGATAATLTFNAVLASPARAARNAFKAGGVEWSCTTTQCTGKGPANDPSGTCKALVSVVGPLSSCGAKIPQSMAMAPAATVIQKPAGMTPSVTPQHVVPAAVAAGSPPVKSGIAPAAAPAAPPAKSSGTTHTTIAITTPQFTLTGTGVYTPTTHPALSWTAPMITLTGTGALDASATRPPANIAFTTPTFTITGTGNP
jgi:hypothetical protein